MDHIVPVVEGGGACGLENLRTLCKPCHKRVTAELAGRRAVAKRKAVTA
jgi:5-methylcytosine-specific restriction endonuclease McrA